MTRTTAPRRGTHLHVERRARRVEAGATEVDARRVDAAGPEAVLQRAEGDRATCGGRRRALQRGAQQALHHRQVEGEEQPDDEGDQRHETAKPAPPPPGRGRWALALRRGRHGAMVSREVSAPLTAGV